MTLIAALQKQLCRHFSVLKRLLATLTTLLERALPGKPATTGTYRAVTVFSTARCCEAARSTGASPLLCQNMPQLPLPGCTMPDHCLCRLREWPDRRIGERRFVATDAPPSQQAPADQRAGRERRR